MYEYCKYLHVYIHLRNCSPYASTLAPTFLLHTGRKLLRLTLLRYAPPPWLSYVCVHACSCVYHLYVQIHIICFCMCISIYVYMYTNIIAYVYVHIHTYIYIYMYTDRERERERERDRESQREPENNKKLLGPPASGTGPSSQDLRSLVPKPYSEWYLEPESSNIRYLEPLGQGCLRLKRSVLGL